MRSRRINSSPSSRWAFQTSRPGPPALNCAEDGSSSTVLQRHIHCPAIRRLASGQHARVLRKLVASSQPGYAAIFLSISRRTSIRFSTRFISKIYGTPAALCICCLRPSTPPYPAPPPEPSPRHGDGSDSCGRLPVEHVPTHSRRNPAPYQRIQHVRLSCASSTIRTTSNPPVAHGHDHGAGWERPKFPSERRRRPRCP